MSLAEGFSRNLASIAINYNKKVIEKDADPHDKLPTDTISERSRATFQEQRLLGRHGVKLGNTIGNTIGNFSEIP